MSFDLNKSSVAIAVAMVGTIRNGDDASRFATRANAEGFSSISQLIAADAVKQARAIEEELKKFVKSAEIPSPAIAPPVSVPTVTEADTNATVTVGQTAEPVEVAGSNNDPLPFVPSAEVAGNTTLTNTTTATASGVELDANGLPWDARIHSSSKEKLVKGGGWKLKRGVDKDLVDQVETELKAALSAPAPAQTTTAVNEAGLNPFSAGNAIGTVPGATSTSVGVAPTANIPTNPLPDQANAVQTAAVSVAPPETASSDKIDTFAKLMPAITKAKLDPAYVTQVVQQFGLPSMPVLATRPDLIPVVAEALGLV